MKFGFQMYYVRWHFQNNAQLNGTFTIPSNNSFNPADPRTYPERLTIQAPTDQYITMKQWAYTGFLQDKWHVSSRATFNLGLRYDIDFTPLDETGNKYFSDASAYPVDKNNLSPRVGFTYTLDESGKSLLRTGWGLFYDKTNFGLLNSYVTSGVNAASVTAQFPADAIDPGPRAGRLPTDPMLKNGPVINYALLNALYPSGSSRSEHRRRVPRQPGSPAAVHAADQRGYQRQLGGAVSASADYVHTMARDQWQLENLNPGLRVNTTASGAINRVDPTLRDERVAAAEYRRVHLRCAERDPGKTRLQQLERPHLLHAGEFARELQRRRDRDEQLPAADRLQSRGGTRTDRL